MPNTLYKKVDQVIKRGDLDGLRAMLSAGKINIDSVDSDGYTLLHVGLPLIPLIFFIRNSHLPDGCMSFTGRHMCFFDWNWG